MKRANRALTIIELLIVVALILILAMLLVVGGGHAHSSAIELQCRHHLEQIGQACSVYVSQNQGLWPRSCDPSSARQWYWTLAPRYISDTAVFNCPATDARLSEPPRDTTNMTRQERVESAVLKALRWLKNQQLANGEWPANPGGTTAAHPVVLGMVLDAFLRTGCTVDEPSEFAQTVDRGLAAAVRVTQGLVGTWEGENAAYGTLLAAFAKAYYAMGDRVYQVGSRSYSIVECARQLLELIRLNMWPQHGGMDYARPGYPGRNNMSIASWVLTGVADAQNAGLPVPEAVLQGVDKQLLHCTVIANRYYCTSPSCRMCTSTDVFCSVCQKKLGYSAVNRVCGQQVLGTRNCPGIYRPCGWRGDTGASTCPRSGCGATLTRSWVGDGTELVGGSCPVCGGSVTKATDDYRPAEYDAWPSTARGSIFSHSFGSYTPFWTTSAVAARLILGSRYAPISGDGYSPGEITQRQLNLLLDGPGSPPDATKNIYTFAFRSNWDAWTIHFATMVMKELGGDRWTDWQNRYIDVVVFDQNPDGSWSISRMPIFAAAPRLGQVGTTALLCEGLVFSLNDWRDIDELTADGRCTYGYNNQIGRDPRTPSPDTVIVMDYENWQIDRDGQLADDPPEYVAPRHGGRLSALFADGRVESFSPETIRNGMFTVQPGD